MATSHEKRAIQTLYVIVYDSGICHVSMKVSIKVTPGMVRLGRQCSQIYQGRQIAACLNLASGCN